MTAETAITVGFVGLGNMGIPMTRRLVGAGYQVRGFDVVAEARGNFEAIGASDAGGEVTAITELGAVGVRRALARVVRGADRGPPVRPGSGGHAGDHQRVERPLRSHG